MAIKLYWIRPDCSELYYFTLQPGAEAVQGSGPLAHWRVRDAASGALIRDFDAPSEPATITIGVEQTSPNPPPTPSTTTTTAAGRKDTFASRAQRVRFCTDDANAGCHPSATPSIAAGAGVTMVCWQDGSSYTGDYATNRWFWVRSGATEGFVSASIVRNQTPTPSCSANRAITAAETALARYGQTSASAADLALFTRGEWLPGPAGEWAGDCPKLPYVGWKAVGVALVKNDAKTNYAYYRDRRLIQAGAPPVGAVTFWNITSLGHEAIGIGDGWVVSTQGLDKQGLPNTVFHYSAKANFLGWYLPA